jgi:CHAD domain-containing protein
MNEPMRDFARTQTATLLDRLAYQAGRAAKRSDEETVHDLRVAIRRLGQCLRVFGPLLPGKTRKVRRKLRAAMRLAAEVRNCDVALELVTTVGAGPRTVVVQQLRERRAAAHERLLREVKRWKRRNFSLRWRDRMGL